jgi:hypothetical protein
MQDPSKRRKIRQIENNAKCRYLNGLTPYTLYTCVVYLFTQAKEEGGESQSVRRLEGQYTIVYKAGRKYQHA